jgi:hypothetical protein
MDDEAISYNERIASLLTVARNDKRGKRGIGHSEPAGRRISKILRSLRSFRMTKIARKYHEN